MATNNMLQIVKNFINEWKQASGATTAREAIDAFSASWWQHHVGVIPNAKEIGPYRVPVYMVAAITRDEYWTLFSTALKTTIN
jgi:hypothetical protein